MTPEAMSEALAAILEEAVKLLAFDLPAEADRIVELIISIARYEHDVRTDAESTTSNPNVVETREERKRREMLDSDNPEVWTKLA